MIANGPAMRRLRGILMRWLPSMITCRELDAFLVDYLGGELPAKQRRLFERHIRFCPDCRRYLERYRLAIEASGPRLAQVDEPVPQDLVDAVVETLRSRE